MLLSRIRLGGSYLKSHSHSIGLSDMNACLCNDTVLESALHYITQCPNFAELCLTIHDEMEQHFIPNFKSCHINFNLWIWTIHSRNNWYKFKNYKINTNIPFEIQTVLYHLEIVFYLHYLKKVKIWSIESLSLYSQMFFTSFHP